MASRSQDSFLMSYIGLNLSGPFSIVSPGSRDCLLLSWTHLCTLPLNMDIYLYIGWLLARVLRRCQSHAVAADFSVRQPPRRRLSELSADTHSHRLYMIGRNRLTAKFQGLPEKNVLQITQSAVSNKFGPYILHTKNYNNFGNYMGRNLYVII